MIRSGLGLAFRALLLLFGLALVARADRLAITSQPSGATVEIDGVVVGLTPFEKDFPGGYFHRTKTSIGSRLEHPMVARVSLDGYATKEVPLSEGPMNWVGLNGKNHGEYWLLKTTSFHIELEPISEVFTGNVTSRGTERVSAEPVAELSMQDVIARTKPAVVYLKGLGKAGTGFFVSDTGVIATNAHVARGEESLLTLLAGGLQLEAKVVFIDADLDIALAKVEGHGFPHLTLADASTVKQGESVMAIGNPGDAMLFSVTKGIVSGVGRFPSAGPGTWIQTDAPINPGNSGGPLLNERGEVVGISTQKLVKRNVNGIGFALSATDLLRVLHRFYPDVAGTQVAVNEAGSVATRAKMVRASSSEDSGGDALGDGGSAESRLQKRAGVGTVTVTSDPDGAELFVDGKFVGNSPARLKLVAGPHAIVLRCKACVEWKRDIEVMKDSQVILDGALREE